jgi:hypothetical protein
MKKVIRLTERELTNLVKRLIKETDKEQIIQGIINGKQSKSQYGEYTAEEAMNEGLSYVESMGCSEGKNRLLQDVNRFIEEAQKELSEEEFEKFYSDIDELMQEIDEFCSDDDEEDDDDFYHGGEGSGGRW